MDVEKYSKQLEEIIESVGIKETIGLLSNICHAKADHPIIRLKHKKIDERMKRYCDPTDLVGLPMRSFCLEKYWRDLGKKLGKL